MDVSKNRRCGAQKCPHDYRYSERKKGDEWYIPIGTCLLQCGGRKEKTFAQWIAKMYREKVNVRDEDD